MASKSKKPGAPKSPSMDDIDNILRNEPSPERDQRIREQFASVVQERDQQTDKINRCEREGFVLVWGDQQLIGQVDALKLELRKVQIVADTYKEDFQNERKDRERAHSMLHDAEMASERLKDELEKKVKELANQTRDSVAGKRSPGSSRDNDQRCKQLEIQLQEANAENEGLKKRVQHLSTQLRTAVGNSQELQDLQRHQKEKEAYTHGVEQERDALKQEVYQLKQMSRGLSDDFNGLCLTEPARPVPRPTPAVGHSKPPPPMPTYSDLNGQQIPVYDPRDVPKPVLHHAKSFPRGAASADYSSDDEPIIRAVDPNVSKQGALYQSVGGDTQLSNGNIPVPSRSIPRPNALRYDQPLPTDHRSFEHRVSQSVGGVSVSQLRLQQHRQPRQQRGPQPRQQQQQQQSPMSIPGQRPTDNVEPMQYSSSQYNYKPHTPPPTLPLSQNSQYDIHSESPIFHADHIEHPPEPHYPAPPRRHLEHPIVLSRAQRSPVYENLSQNDFPTPHDIENFPPPILESRCDFSSSIRRQETPPLPPRLRRNYDTPRYQPSLTPTEDVGPPPPLPPKPKLAPRTVTPTSVSPPIVTRNERPKPSPRSSRGESTGTDDGENAHSSSRMLTKPRSNTDISLISSASVLDGIPDTYREFIDGKDSRHRDTCEHVPLDPNLVCPHCSKQYRKDQTQKCSKHIRCCRHNKEDGPSDNGMECVLDGVDSRKRKTNELVPFDPNLICPVCQHQFRFDETQKCKFHIIDCLQLREKRLQEWNKAMAGDSKEFDLQPTSSPPSADQYCHQQPVGEEVVLGISPTSSDHHHQHPVGQENGSPLDGTGAATHKPIARKRSGKKRY